MRASYAAYRKHVRTCFVCYENDWEGESGKIIGTGQVNHANGRQVMGLT